MGEHAEWACTAMRQRKQHLASTHLGSGRAASYHAYQMCKLSGLCKCRGEGEEMTVVPTAEIVTDGAAASATIRWAVHVPRGTGAGGQVATAAKGGRVVGKHRITILPEDRLNLYALSSRSIVSSLGMGFVGMSFPSFAVLFSLMSAAQSIMP